MNRTKHNPYIGRFFSLIELLIVILIIGILAVMIIPRFTDIEKHARENMSKYSQGEVGRFLNMFKVANKGYPSGFHTGIHDRESAAPVTDSATGENVLPSTILNQIGDKIEIVPLTYEQKKSLQKSGVNFLAYGYNLRYPEVVRPEASEKYHVLSALNPVDENNKEVSFNNRTLEQWRYKGNLTAINHHNDQADGIVVILFVGPTVDWEYVYRGGMTWHGDHYHFDIEEKSKIGMDRRPVVITESSNTKFRYYVAFFKLFDDGSEAQLIGVASPELTTADND